MRYILTLICISFSVTALSQSVTETRVVKTTALEVYENYISIIGNLYNGNVYNLDVFLSLFDENAELYNDILPENNPQILNPQQYYDIFTNNIKLSYYRYDKIELEFPTLKDDKWIIICEFGRQVRFKTYNKYYPRWHFNYILTVTMDTVYDAKKKIYRNAKIQSISVKEPLTDFFIIENPHEYILEYNEETIDNWDKDYYSRTFSNKVVDKNLITVSDKKFFNAYDLIEDVENQNFFQIQKLKKDLFGFGIYYTPYGSGNRISHTAFPNIKQKNQGLSTELLYGLQLAQSNNSALFLNTKLNLNIYQNLFQGIYYTEYTSFDTDNDPYLRKIRINSLQERFYSFSASIPLSLEYLFRISKKPIHPYFISLEAGGFFEYRAWAINKISVKADYTGLYNYYGGVEFDHYYDYGHYVLNNKNVNQDIVSKINDYDYGAFASIGMLFARDKNNLFKFNIIYKYGMQPLLLYRDNFIVSENHTTYETLLQNSNQGIRNIYLGLSYIHTITRNASQK